MNEQESDFGKGFTYCLGLFLAHQHMFDKNEETRFMCWFNGASDHLYEMEIPENFILKDACEAWKQECLYLGHGRGLLSKVTEKDISWALEKAKEFLMEWDKQQGIAVVKGRWE